MNKKIIIKLVCIIAIIFCVFSNVSMAAWNAIDQINTIETYTVSNDGGIGDTTKNIVGTIINVIRIVGTGVAIIMITYVAIKYMSAAPQEKADFKKSAMAMIVGAIVLFAGTNILNLIANFATINISTTSVTTDTSGSGGGNASGNGGN